MKKKILAISICVCICFALLAIPAFATSAPETTSAPNVFGTLFDSGASYTLSFTADLSCTESAISSDPSFKNWLIAMGATSSGTAIGPFSIATGNSSVSDYISANIYVSSSGRIAQSSGTSNMYVYRVENGQTYTVNSSLGLVEAQSLPSSVTVTVSGQDGLVPELADEVFSVGGSLISFVMSHWIVLIPVVAFLVILCIGAIRKLIKGE